MLISNFKIVMKTIGITTFYYLGNSLFHCTGERIQVPCFPRELRAHMQFEPFLIHEFMWASYFEKIHWPNETKLNSLPNELFQVECRTYTNFIRHCPMAKKHMAAIQSAFVDLMANCPFIRREVSFLQRDLRSLGNDNIAHIVYYYNGQYLCSYYASIELNCDLCELEEYASSMAATDDEYNALLDWYLIGNCIYENPAHACSDEGGALDFITFMRVVDPDTLPF